MRPLRLDGAHAPLYGRSAIEGGLPLPPSCNGAESRDSAPLSFVDHAIPP